MSYTTIPELPNVPATLTGSEYLLLTDSTTSYKLSLTVLNDYLADISQGTYQELTNKVIDSVTNFVHANAIHYVATAVGNIPKGTPVTIVPNTSSSIVYVRASASNTDLVAGVCEDGLTDGQQGEIMVAGVIDGFDTHLWDEGTLLYFQNGAFTNNPTTGVPSQILGFILHSAVSGKVLITNSASNVIASQVEYDNTDGLLDSIHVQGALSELAMRKIKTSPKLGITNNTATLPVDALGGVINDIAMVFKDTQTGVFVEYTCTTAPDGLSVIFDPEDHLNGYTCIVSYLAKV